MPKRTPAAQQFTDLGIPEADWTPAMQLAVKQRWSGLPVTSTVAELRAELAKVEAVATPTAERLVEDGMAQAEAEAEAKRLKRNAAVNAWRTKTQVQAALDGRDLRFKRMRAGKGSKAPAAPVVEAEAPAADADDATDTAAEVSA